MKIVVAVLAGCEFIFYSSTVDAHRRTGLHSVGFKAQIAQLFGDAISSRLGTATAVQLCASDMHQAVEKRPCGEHHRARRKGHAEGGTNARNAAAVDDKFAHGVLPHI